SVRDPSLTMLWTT
nr:immunoglobulin heavy chain junction region [Mus musculus]